MPKRGKSAPALGRLIVLVETEFESEPNLDVEPVHRNISSIENKEPPRAEETLWLALGKLAKRTNLQTGSSVGISVNHAERILNGLLDPDRWGINL